MEDVDALDDSKMKEPDSAPGVDQVNDVEVLSEEIAQIDGVKEVKGATWANKREYLLVLMGTIIDMWRFPYLVKKNGGVVFLIPCIIFLFVAGIPIFFLELALGQVMQRGAIGSWSAISPYLSGIGIASGVICVVLNIYFNNIFVWSISYFVWSFSPILPWSTCQNHTYVHSYLLYNPEGDLTNYTQASHMKHLVTMPKEECQLSGPTKYYWFRETLNISGDIWDYGGWNWFMTMYLVVSWFIIYLSLIRGPKSSGKVAYLTTIFPYVALITFLIGGICLGDFSEGFFILFAPDWSKLFDGKVWLDAGTQICFTLCLGFGVCSTLASYQPRSNNLHIEAYLMPILCFLTQILVSCTFFIILGFKGIKEYKECLQARNYTVNFLLDIDGFLQADFYSQGWTLKSINFPRDHFISQLNVTLTHANGSGINVHIWGDENNTEDIIYAQYCDKEEIVRNTGSGSGLIFITFCEAVANFPIGQIWSVLFFAVMLAIGICGTSGTVEGIVSAVSDFNLKGLKRWEITIGVNIFLMIITVILFSPGNGLYIYAFIDELCTGWPLLTVSLAESLAISYYYGLERFSREITLMTGIRPNSYLLLCWKFLSPLTIVVILLYSLVFAVTDKMTYKRWRSDLGRNEDKVWDPFFIGMSSTVDFFLISIMPLVALLAYFKIYLVRETPPIFPEEELRQIKGYDEEKDRRSTSTLQRLLMTPIRRWSKWKRKLEDPKDVELSRKDS